MKLKILTILFLFIAAANSQAEKYEILTSSATKPEKALGLIFDSKGTNLINQTSISSIAGQKDLYLVSFESDKAGSDNFVSAILIDQADHQSFSSVISAKTAQQYDLSKLPVCSAFSDIPDLNSQSELLAQLVNVRSKIKEHELDLIANELDPATLELLASKEKELGLANGKLFSADLPAAELNMRLFKILNALNN